MAKKRYHLPIRISFFTELYVKQDVEDVLEKAGMTMTEFLNHCMEQLRTGKLKVRPASPARVEEVIERSR